MWLFNCPTQYCIQLASDVYYNFMTLKIFLGEVIIYLKKRMEVFEIFLQTFRIKFNIQTWYTYMQYHMLYTHTV